jgi:NADH:quinone reductase (non-electrogenic)
VRVVIIGGGFAAVQFAKALRKNMSVAECEILVFSRENHMVFHPLLADVAGASINPDAAAAPLRQMLPKVGCRTERVVRIDLAASEIEIESGEGILSRMHYDHVVVACGADSNLGIIPGMSDHAFPFKVMSDAVFLRQHVVKQMELAEAATTPESRRWHLSFIIVGAGFSGVEVAGEINELVRSSTRFYHNFKEEDVVVTVVHSQDQVLPEVAPTLRAFAGKKMQKNGITLLLKTRAAAATHEGIALPDGTLLRGATIVCTIGTTPTQLVQQLDVPKEKGRIRTTPEMRIVGHENAWAVGDCAYIINAFDNTPAAPTGQFAEREGRQAALNLVRVLKGQPTRPFSFKVLGQLCSIGGYEAVAEMMGVRVSGFLAWFLWRGVYLFKLPTWSRRVKVALDWAWDFVFPRNLSFLNNDPTETASHAYYRAGDYVHHQGEAVRVFSIIDEGEVEISKTSEENPQGVVLGVLSKGDFFGEGLLLGATTHETSVRARTAVRLTQLGSSLFSQLAGASAPLRELMAQAAHRRSGDFWGRLPLTKFLSPNEPVTGLLDPLPAESLTPDTAFGDAVRTLNASVAGALLILDAQGRLWGTMDRQDLYAILTRVALSPAGQRTDDLPQRKLGALLAGNSLYITQDDSVLVASITMLDHGLSWIPVVHSKDDLRPVGRIRADRIGSHMMEKLDQSKASNATAAS